MEADLDDVDRLLLYELQRDARQPVESLADRVGVPPAEAQERIDALEARDVVEGDHAQVNYDTAGVQHHYAFRCSARASQREQLAAKVREELGVTQISTLMTGRNNLWIFGAGSEKDDVTGLAYNIDRLGIDIESEALIREHWRQPFEGSRLVIGRHCNGPQHRKPPSADSAERLDRPAQTRIARTRRPSRGSPGSWTSRYTIRSRA